MRKMVKTGTYLEEEQKNGFSDWRSSNLRIFERVFDFSLTKENVSAAGSPQHLLEGRNSFSKNHTGDEAEMNTPLKIKIHCFRTFLKSDTLELFNEFHLFRVL